MTSNNPDHPSHNWGPVKSTIHIQLTTMLTIRVIIGALWNQQYIYNWQQCWLSKLSSGPCQTTKHTQLTTAITIKVNNRTCCRSASLTIIITIKAKPHLLWTTQLPSSQQFHLLWYTQLTTVMATRVNNHTKGPVVSSGSGRVGGENVCVCVCACFIV